MVLALRCEATFMHSWRLADYSCHTQNEDRPGIQREYPQVKSHSRISVSLKSWHFPQNK
jgi:hypothetical protein